ncbi:shikimate dehydrogenase [Serinibacter arcticus]|uniref:shikimate dehydrogenase (NADP(+)) n=1 Tax=Serinibacter arcticus TaxID=1655435 RepID=A0A2U1ZZ92_9MICO|nr:shikimate dehydrogenase [Serinibacter arcticus]
MTPRRAAVIGHPVGHSLSPVLHRAAYAALGLPHTYEAIDVPDGGAPGLLAGLDAGWLGLSVTMPHKHAVLEAADVVEPLARTVGAANTVLVTASGPHRLLVAANTDVHGAAEALREVRPAGTPPARTAVVLGAGGTAAAVLAALAELGVTTPVVCVRSQARAAGLLQAAHRMGVDVTLRRFDHAADLIADADLVVQTAVAGAADPVAAELATVLGERRLRPGQTLLDVIYDPWPTALAAVWSGAGGAVAPGSLMLLHQAAEQVRLMTGLPAPVDAMRAALEAATRA